MSIALYAAIAIVASNLLGTPPIPRGGGSESPGGQRVAIPSPYIFNFRPGAAICAGTPVVARMMAEPLPTGAYVMPGMAESLGGYTIRFRIDRDGRPLGIGWVGRDSGTGTQPFFSVEDLEPSLAASRFEPGERQDCTITYVPQAVPVATAPPAVLNHFLAVPRIGYVGWREAVERDRAEAADCVRGRRPEPLLATYPDPRTIVRQAGTYTWTITEADIAPSGVPTNVRTKASGGDEALDRSNREAVSRSRFVIDGPKNGCRFVYFRWANVPIPAPPMPSKDSTPKPVHCARPPELLAPLQRRYPVNFERRSIEGWAIVSFDVAPWGVVGNVKVLDSQPSAAFGDMASAMMQQARRVATPLGASGCVERVRFRMPGSNNGSPDAPVSDVVTVY